MDLFDVFRVDIDTKELTTLAEKKTYKNAEAIENFAIMRQGFDGHYFMISLHGKYKDGDILTDEDDEE